MKEIFNIEQVIDILKKSMSILNDKEQSAEIISKAFPDITTKDEMLHLIDNFYDTGFEFVNRLEPDKKDIFLKVLVGEIIYQVPSIDINNVIVQLKK
jgi:hypothetical protein